ncbi:MAG: membrane protein insertase YidC [Fimbriimonas sp.]|nr:membrane protein insertase YidC [Fimbriimonas sp.]
MSKPTPKQNFLQTALLMITIFLGIQLFFGPKNQNTATRTVDQVYAELLRDNSLLKDQSVRSTVGEYNQLLDEAVKKRQLSKADAETKKIEATVLEADTQLKAGLWSNDTGRIRDAYQTLVPYQKKLVDTPAWTHLYSVMASKIASPATNRDGTPLAGSTTKFDWNAWSGQALYHRVVELLTDRNQTDYVYGIIPGFQLMDLLVHLTGAQSGFSYAFAAFLLALCVRGIVFPLAQKQLMFSRQMSQLGPLTAEIKQKYKNDQQTQQQKVMELYKEYGINPLAGCFPALIQMPLFLTIYQCMVRYQFAFQKGTFLWINPSTSKHTSGFIAPNLGQQDYLLIIIYGITMVIATMLTPVTDPSQAKQQRLMGVGVSVIFTVFMFLGAIPVVSGFVLYWTFTNILATAQSLRAYRLPLPPLVKLAGAGGGAIPRSTSKWQQMMDKMMEEQRRQAERNGAPSLEKPDRNGSAANTQEIFGEAPKTGAPAKHKPKKRK